MFGKIKVAPPEEKEEDITPKDSFPQSLHPPIFSPPVERMNEDSE